MKVLLKLSQILAVASLVFSAGVHARKMDLNDDQRFFEYGIESASALDSWVTQFIADVKSKDIGTVSKKN